ncbi:hypothetical protein C8Q80DRAFT_1152885 [Daedaleopsis nitida]|nr:hypothetical protein C8Q80DRAFT_1152885 [Daedaleopsis nitida]
MGTDVPATTLSVGSSVASNAVPSTPSVPTPILSTDAAPSPTAPTTQLLDDIPSGQGQSKDTKSATKIPSSVTDAMTRGVPTTVVAVAIEPSALPTMQTSARAPPEASTPSIPSTPTSLPAVPASSPSAEIPAMLNSTLPVGPSAPSVPETKPAVPASAPSTSLASGPTTPAAPSGVPGSPASLTPSAPATSISTALPVSKGATLA